MSGLERVLFYRQGSGREPVNEWLVRLKHSDRIKVGEDIKRLQSLWPVGMPLVRKLDTGLWELRSRLSCGFVRTFFSIDGDVLVLLHAYIKKSRKIPVNELRIAKRRLSKLRS